MPKKKGAPKTGGRKRGTPDKLTYEVIDKLDDLGFDPLELAVEIVKGEKLAKDHPYLPEIIAFCNWLTTQYKDKIKETRSKGVFIRQVNEFAKRATKALSNNYVDPTVRAGMVRTLMEYRYPKRKALEFVDQTPKDTQVTDLTDAELEQIIREGESEVINRSRSNSGGRQAKRH